MKEGTVIFCSPPFGCLVPASSPLHPAFVDMMARFGLYQWCKVRQKNVWRGTVTKDFRHLPPWQGKGESVRVLAVVAILFRGLLSFLCSIFGSNPPLPFVGIEREESLVV